MATKITIGPRTTAQNVRKELFQATAQENWLRDDYWKFFLKRRHELLDTVYDELENKDWLNPATADRAEVEFVKRAPEHWGAVTESWVLEGGWIEKRADLVAWMRSAYWKSNRKFVKKRIARKAVPMRGYLGNSGKAKEVSATQHIDPTGGMDDENLDLQSENRVEGNPRRFVAAETCAETMLDSEGNGTVDVGSKTWRVIVLE